MRILLIFHPSDKYFDLARLKELINTVRELIRALAERDGRGQRMHVRRSQHRSPLNPFVSDNEADQMTK